MRPRTVLILLVLVVGLVAFIELYEGDLPSSDERAALDRLVLPIERGGILAIDLESDVGTISFERAEETGVEADWRMTRPYEAPADKDLMRILIDGLVELEKKRALDGMDRSEAGLEPPRMTVVLTEADTRHRLEVGAEIPAAEAMIVAVEGSDGPWVVDDLVWADLSRPAGDWRRRQVFPFDPATIQRVAITNEAGVLELSNREGDFWIDGSVVDRADATRVEELLAALSSLEIGQFVDGQLGSERRREIGLDAGARELEVEVDGVDSPFRLLWGAPVADTENRSYAEAAGQVFEVESSLGSYLETVAQEDWRSRAVSGLEAFEIDSLQVVQPDRETLQLQRSGAEWQRNNQRITFPSVSELLYAVTGLEAFGFDDSSTKKRGPGEPPESLLKIVLGNENRLETLVFEDSDEGAVVVWSDERPSGLLLTRVQFTELLQNLESVRAADSVGALENEQQ